MNIGVVTVTYGDRRLLLMQMLEAVLSLSSVAKVVVVSNGAADGVMEKVIDLGGDRIVPVELGRNLGSAAGFGAGIRAACETGCEYIWLLDDDNVPSPEALDVLIKEYERLEIQTPRDKLALQAMRPGRILFERVARGDCPDRWFPIDNSYLGFHLRRALAKLFGRGGQTGEYLDSAAIPFGVYGGLFFHRAVPDKIGLPLAELFLYGDDNEYTLRFTRTGGSLYLIPQSRVEDAERSWASGDVGKRSSLAARQAVASGAQVCYSLRNGTWFSRKYYCRNRAVYAANKWVYLGRLAAGLILRGQIGRLPLACRAVRDGERGKLGQNPAFEL